MIPTRGRTATLVLGLGAVGVMVMTSIASASHPRPLAASRMQVSLVPAYQPCTAPNRTHGPPLASPSCNPPVQSSSFLTVGTPAANGTGANSVGLIRIKVVPSSPNSWPPEQLEVTASISDVRCTSGNPASVCSGANKAAGPDYLGDLEVLATIRISDHNNGPNADEPATMSDIPFPIRLICGGTSDPSIGSLCSANASVVSIYPNPPVPPRSVVEVGQIKVFDGGPDGRSSTLEGNTVFAVQGVFIP